MATYPSGYTQANAIAMVQLRTDETTLPSTANVVSLLNAGLEQASNRIGPIEAQGSVALAAAQNTTALPEDVQDVLWCSFSTTGPSTPGSTVYPMWQVDPAQFFDLAGYVPGNGYGPPAIWTITADQTGQLQIQIFPPASPAGQLNLYYRQRPQLWDPNNSASVTQMDSQYQECAILWTCARICEAREKYVIADHFMKQYEAAIEEAKRLQGRRLRPKSSRVRDVMTRPVAWPAWWSSNG